jgi:hypothetical protein
MSVWASAWSGRWREVRFDGINSIFSIQMTRNRHWHIFNLNDIRGDVRTIQNNSIEYYTITASLLHIVRVIPNIISIKQTPSRHLFNPLTMKKWHPNGPEQCFMVKIRIGCDLLILNATNWPDGPRYYLSRTHSESVPIEPNDHKKWCPNHPEQILMGKIGIGCYLFISNATNCPGGQKYYFDRTHSESAPIQPDYNNKWCPNHL